MLEDRHMLATIIVTSLLDNYLAMPTDGAVTLREAVLAASGQSGLSSNDSIVITSGTTISDNHASLGGGVHVELHGASLTIESSMLDDNVATNGGGLWAALKSASTALVTDSLFSLNDADHDGTGSWLQIFGDSIATFSGVTFEELVFTISEAVHDVAGNALDGEWVNPQFLGDSSGKLFPSGIGVRFGDFVFNVTFLPGDYMRDNIVDGQDFIAWNSHRLTMDNRWQSGNGNNDGWVDGQDFVLWNTNKFLNWTHLPTRGTDREKIRRAIDELIDIFGVIEDGTVNAQASQATWIRFADAVEYVLRLYGEI
jgi:hypothetical protein